MRLGIFFLSITQKIVYHLLKRLLSFYDIPVYTVNIRAQHAHSYFPQMLCITNSEAVSDRK